MKTEEMLTKNSPPVVSTLDASTVLTDIKSLKNIILELQTPTTRISQRGQLLLTLLLHNNLSKSIDAFSSASYALLGASSKNLRRLYRLQIKVDKLSSLVSKLSPTSYKSGNSNIKRGFTPIIAHIVPPGKGAKIIKLLATILVIVLAIIKHHSS